jgi:hypothetical protein
VAALTVFTLPRFLWNTVRPAVAQQAPTTDAPAHRPSDAPQPP